MSDTYALAPAQDLDQKNAFEFIKDSVTRPNLLGEGDNYAVFALNGFDDDALNHRYALRINKNYVPQEAIGINKLGQEHHPWFDLDQLLKRSTCLTPPNQLYIGHHMSQPLLRDLEQDEDYTTALFSIVPRHSGKSVKDRIWETADLSSTFGHAESFIAATEKAAEAYLAKLQKNPQPLIDLFREAYELGWYGVKLEDVHYGNIVEGDDGRLSVVDVFNGADKRQLNEPYQEPLAKANMDELYDSLGQHLSDMLSVTDNHVDFDPRVKELFDQCYTKAQEAKLPTASERLNANAPHSAGFALVNHITAKPTRIDKDSSAKDLLGALNELHGAIGAGRGA